MAGVRSGPPPTADQRRPFEGSGGQGARDPRLILNLVYFFLLRIAPPLPPPSPPPFPIVKKPLLSGILLLFINLTYSRCRSESPPPPSFGVFVDSCEKCYTLVSIFRYDTFGTTPAAPLPSSPPPSPPLSTKASRQAAATFVSLGRVHLKAAL